MFRIVQFPHRIVVKSYPVHYSLLNEMTYFNLALFRIRLVHERDLARYCSPFELTAKRFIASLTLEFLPLQEFVSESEMGLNDDIQAPGSDETAVEVS